MASPRYGSYSRTAPSNTPLTADEIETLLEEPLEVEFSFRDTRLPSQGIAGLSREEQEFLLDWIIRVASTHVELGYQIACHGVTALAAMDHHMIEAWALHTMDVYDLSGLRPALQVIEKSAGFARCSTPACTVPYWKRRRGCSPAFFMGSPGAS